MKVLTSIGKGTDKYLRQQGTQMCGQVGEDGGEGLLLWGKSNIEIKPFIHIHLEILQRASCNSSIMRISSYKQIPNKFRMHVSRDFLILRAPEVCASHPAKLVRACPGLS